MRRIFLFLLVLTTVTVSARQISPEEAFTIATEFFAKNTCDDTHGRAHKTIRRALSPEAVPTAHQPFYIFNSGDSSGFVIVSGDDRTAVILGYSDEGYIDLDNMPLPLEHLLNRYSGSILDLGTRLPIKSTFNGKRVDPLIKSEWGQGAPFNGMLPIIYGDTRAVTGCTNTSQAQVMRYHKFPLEHGNGILSYTSAYGDTYSVDLSKSRYDWDNMLDVYEYNDGEKLFTKENEDAVALLIRDIAYANQTEYGNESGAAHNYVALTENFGYDKSIRIIDYKHLSLDEYESLLRNELDNGRPCFIDGVSGNGSSAHDFICDGYDEKGYFHYNFGWGSGSNGYFLSTATGFDISQSTVIGIRPDSGGKIINSAGSDSDFEYTEGLIKCELYHGNVFRYPMEHSVATVCENVSTGQKTYTIGYTGNDWYNIYEMPLPEELQDGKYIVYPAMKVSGEEWQNYKFTHGRQSFIDLSVENGVKTYTNNHILDLLDDGKVEIDGVFYILHEDNTAEVTFKNNKYNSYSGNVTIPDQIEVNGQSYTVSIIGNNAFHSCDIQTLRLPKSLYTINAAFLGCSVDKMVFEEPSDIKEIGGWGFNAITIDEIRLPQGVESIGTAAFQSFGGRLIEIPSSVKRFGRYPFTACQSLRDVVVHWDNQNDMPSISPDYHLFDQCNWDEITLYVPDGTAEMYRNAPQWSDLNIKEMSEYSGIDDIQVNSSEMMPIYYDLMGRQIEGDLRPGIYVKRLNNKATKVIIR